MVKSNRRRQQDRRKRQSATAQHGAAAERRRLHAMMLAESERRHALLRDPDTPVETVAALILETFTPDSGGPPPGLAAVLASHRGSVDSVVAVAAALRGLEAADGVAPSLSALAFGAQAAALARDFATARVLLDSPGARPADPADEPYLAGHLAFLGRTADAIALLAAHVGRPSYDSVAAPCHGHALEAAAAHLAEGRPGECPCGTGKTWADCCRARETAALEAFADRSGLYALRAAVQAFVPGSAYADAVAGHVQEWVDELSDADPFGADLSEPLALLAFEHAWVAAGAGPDEVNPYDFYPDDGPDDELDAAADAETVLDALAADPGTPPEVAARALRWRQNVRYGMWQVADPVPAPGLWCTDVCTGQELYIALAPEQVEALPRWTVMLGAVVPLDGAWRSTGAMVWLAPGEADALCETVQATAEAMMDVILGRGTPDDVYDVMMSPSPFGHAEPYSVNAWVEEAGPPEFVDAIGKVLGSMLPRVHAELMYVRGKPPGMSNTDGEPMRLITARVAVRDAADLAVRLSAHPDFGPDDTDDGPGFTWLGLEIPAAQRAAMFAEARAQLIADGHDIGDYLDAADDPSRWVRAKLAVRGDEVGVNVNSRERLDGVLDVLRELGAEPTIVEQSQVDPAQDLPWSGGHRTLAGGMAAPEDGWEKQWLDEPVPALRGRTPRQAAGSSDRPRLEALLRQFEYDSDLLGFEGQRGVDVRWLREQLGCPVSTWSRPVGAGPAGV